MTSTNTRRTLGVGLISVGWMGRLHSRAYRNLPYVYPELGVAPRFVHAADTAEAGRDYAADVLGYERVSADYRAVLADPDVDVVSICAPNFLHAEIGVAAAEAGKPFWIEKPVGRDAADTAAVRDAAIAAGVPTSIGFNYRHAPAVRLARRLITDGTIGRITNVRGKIYGGFNSSPDAPRAWRFVRALGGTGVLGDLMGHLVDLTHFLVGPISSVTGTTGTYIEERPGVPGTPDEGAVLPVENEDVANMLVRFDDSARASGALGTLEASWIAVGPKAEYQIEVYGTSGSLRWDFERMNELELAVREPGRSDGYRRIVADETFPEFTHFQPGSGTPMGYDDLKVIEARTFVEAVLGTGHDNSTIHDALASTQVLTAAEASAASGQWVQTPVIDGNTSNTRD